MNVGISVLAVAGAHVWSSGLNQNLAFLVMLLKQCPGVQEIYLLNGGNVDTLPEGMAHAMPGIALVKPAEVTYKVDLVIEMGAQLDGEWLRHVRALGAKLVLFQVGNTYTQLAEVPMFDLPGGMSFRDNVWHEVWMLPQFEHISLPLLRTISRKPVHVVPHIWSPVYLDQQIASAQAKGFAFGFRPEAATAENRGWRTAIFEPNISVGKSCFLPMLVCEQAYREAPDSVSLMVVTNSFQMKEHPTFNALACNLDLSRHSKATYEPRLGFADCMSHFQVDAVVSHQWEWGLNYAYYDALYGGYPLVHNSEQLRQAGQGFHYPGFAAREGARALLDAKGRDAGFWRGYRESAARFLESLSPAAPGNVEAFARRLTLDEKAAP